MDSPKARIAIFASGSGSNAEKFFEYFKDSSCAEIVLLCSNNPEAFALERAKKRNIPTWVFPNKALKETNLVTQKMLDEKIDFIVLAGFLRLIPSSLIKEFPDRIVNIHPALLPKWGGKGMYGMHVHQAVINAGEQESGITIHFVNEQYDDGNILFQASCPVERTDTPELVAKKIQVLEHKHFPEIVEKLIQEKGKKSK